MEENQQIVIFEKLEPGNLRIFALKSVINYYASYFKPHKSGAVSIYLLRRLSPKYSCCFRSFDSLLSPE